VAASGIKTYVRPACVCMSIRLHISLVEPTAIIFMGIVNIQVWKTTKHVLFDECPNHSISWTDNIGESPMGKPRITHWGHAPRYDANAYSVPVCSRQYHIANWTKTTEKIFRQICPWLERAVGPTARRECLTTVSVVHEAENNVTLIYWSRGQYVEPRKSKLRLSWQTLIM